MRNSGWARQKLAVELAGERIVFGRGGVVAVHAHAGVAANAVGAAGAGDDVEGVGALGGETAKGVGGELVTAAAEVGDAGADEFGGGGGKVHAAAGRDAPFEDGDGGVGVEGDLAAEVVGVFIAAAVEGAEAIVVDDDELGAVAGLRRFGGGEAGGGGPVDRGRGGRGAYRNGAEEQEAVKSKVMHTRWRRVG
jgi:hypothetical protein